MAASANADHDPTFGGILIIVALVIGLLSRNILTKLPVLRKVPYTVLLLVLGGILGAIGKEVTIGQLSDSLDIWAGVDPHALLYLFLPLLVFESSFNVDFHMFKRLLGHAVTLAVPGLLAATSLTALVAKYVLPYDWDMNQALLMGTVLSATDPVAVVALLKELSVSERLATLIEGESLLNDGTAMVFFIMFRDAIVDHSSVGLVDVIGLFCKMSFGAMAIGLVFAYATRQALGWVYNDAMSEITLTVVGCYATFIFAEATLEVSGVIAVVTFGVLLSGYGRSRITPEVEESVDSFWEMMGYIANSVIFVLTGVIIMQKAILVDDGDPFKITAEDWGYLFILYLLITVIRFSVFAGFSPIMLFTGERHEPRDVAVAAWGGLRGAVGLALALIVRQDAHIDHDYGQKLLFHTSGIAFLTLAVNGTSMRLVLGWLGYLKPDPEEVRLFGKATIQLHKHTKEQWDAVQNDSFLAGADFKQVWYYIPIHTVKQWNKRRADDCLPEGPDDPAIPADVRRRWRRYFKVYQPEAQKEWEALQAKQRSAAERASSSNLMAAPGSMTHVLGTPGLAGHHTVEEARAALEQRRKRRQAMSARVRSANPELLKILRTRFIHTVERRYHHLFEHGLLGRDAMDELLMAEATQTHHVTEPLKQWTHTLHDACTVPWVLTKMYQSPCLRRPASQMIGRLIAIAYDVTHGFVQAHSFVSEQVSRWGFGREASIVIEESRAQVRLAAQQMEVLDRTYPKHSRGVRTRSAIRYIVMTERRFQHKLYLNGELDESEHHLLEQRSNSTYKKVTRSAADELEAVDMRTAIHDCLLFKDLSDHEFEVLERVARQMTLANRSTLFEEGGEVNGMYIVLTGTVELSANHPQSRSELELELGKAGPGHTVGCVDIFHQRRWVTAKAVTPQCEVVYIPIGALRRLWETNSNFNTTLVRRAALVAAGWFMDEFNTCDIITLQAAINKGLVVDDEEISRPMQCSHRGFFLVRGRTSIANGFRNLVDGFGYIPPSEHLVHFKEKRGSPIVLAVPASVMARVHASRNTGVRNPLVSAFHSVKTVDSSRRAAKNIARKIRMRCQRRSEARLLRRGSNADEHGPPGGTAGAGAGTVAAPETIVEADEISDLSSLGEEVVQRVRDGRALDTALARPPNKSLDAAAVAHIQVQLQDAQDDESGSNDAPTPGTAVAAGAPSVVEEGQIVPATPPPGQQ